MGIQIYDQISIARKLSKVKLRRAFSLDFGLKRVQITRNIAKFGMLAFISKGIQIFDEISILGIWSKVKLHHSISRGFGLKVGKMALNITKFFMHSYLTRNLAKICVHTYLPNWHVGAFAKVALKGSENSSKRYESWHVCLFIEMGT